MQDLHTVVTSATIIYVSDGLALVGSILGIPTGAVRLNTGYAEQNPKRMLD